MAPRINKVLNLFLFCSFSLVRCQSYFPCPDPIELKPCTCHLDDLTLLMTLDCSSAKTTSEIQTALNTNFPFFHFGEFRIVGEPSSPNTVTVLPDGLFRNLTFDGILIQNGLLDTLGPNIFEKSYDYMKKIVIEGTLIMSFPFDHLSSFSNLASINLVNNQLINMANLNSATLTYLSVAGNLNLFFSANNFLNVPNLVFANLENTGQNVILKDTFADLFKIEVVDFSDNLLTILETDCLVFPSSSVNFLDLSNNQISEVQAGAVQGLNKLASLYFNNNLISILHENVWRPLFEAVAQSTTTGQIFLEGNPLDCSCTISWLVTNATLLAEISSASACANGGPNIVDLNPSFYSTNC